MPGWFSDRLLTELINKIEAIRNHIVTERKVLREKYFDPLLKIQQLTYKLLEINNKVVQKGCVILDENNEPIFKRNSLVFIDDLDDPILSTLLNGIKTQTNLMISASKKTLKKPEGNRIAKDLIAYCDYCFKVHTGTKEHKNKEFLLEKAKPLLENGPPPRYNELSDPPVYSDAPPPYSESAPHDFSLTHATQRTSSFIPIEEMKLGAHSVTLFNNHFAAREEKHPHQSDEQAASSHIEKQMQAEAARLKLLNKIFDSVFISLNQLTQDNCISIQQIKQLFNELKTEQTSGGAEIMLGKFLLEQEEAEKVHASFKNDAIKLLTSSFRTVPYYSSVFATKLAEVKHIFLTNLEKQGMNLKALSDLHLKRMYNESPWGTKTNSRSP